MAEQLAQRYGLSLFRKHIAQYEPADPMYETFVDKKGRTKRRRRDVPAGLSARDAKILKSVQKRAHYLDKGMNLCGFRVGWTFWIGLIPGAGDVADAALNYFLVVKKARQAEIPDWLVQRMLVNNVVSAGIGFIPILGDVALATFKANSRNAALFEEFMRVRGLEFIKSSGQPALGPGAGVVPGEHVPGKGTVGAGFLSGLSHMGKKAPATGPATNTVATSTAGNKTPAGPLTGTNRPAPVAPAHGAGGMPAQPPRKA